MTPIAEPAASSTASRLQYSGTPWVKALVPSIGSMIQVRPEAPAASASSSPTMASSGNRAAISSRRNRSAALSAAVTGVPSPLRSTARSSERNHSQGQLAGLAHQVDGHLEQVGQLVGGDRREPAARVDGTAASSHGGHGPAVRAHQRARRARVGPC